MSTSNLSPIVPVNYRGIWDGAVSYLTNDVVQFSGIYYLASSSNVGIQPPGSTWNLVSVSTYGMAVGVGATGPAGQMVNNVVDYGAKGDGITDDTAAIQSAISAVPSGGGVVYLPSGRYLVTSRLTIARDNTTLLGDGTGQRTGATQTGNGTRIEVGGGITGSVILVDNGSGTTPVYGTRLAHFTIDGKKVGTAVDGIILRSNRSHTEHVHVHEMSGTGMRLLGYSAPTFNTYDSIVAFCQFGDNTADGFCFDANSADCHMTSCILYNNNYNIRILASSQQITSCHTYNATIDNIRFDGGGSRTKVINCKVEGAGQHGINIDSTNGGYSDIQITGCGLSTNGDSLDNTYDHIIIQGPSSNGTTRTTIVGNNFGWKSSQTPNKNRYGVNMSSSCAQGTVVLSNSFGPLTSIGTAWINNNSSSTTPATIRNNANASDDPVVIPFVNVVSSPYFAKGNGTTDDTAAIQAAINSLPTTGGVVYLPSGQYKITSSLTIGIDNVILMGAGAGWSLDKTQGGAGTLLKVDPTLTGTAILVQRTLNDRTLFGTIIRDLAIDGQALGAATDGVQFRSVQGMLDNVGIHRMTGNGVTVSGYASWNAGNNKFRNVYVDHCTGNGIHIGTLATDNHIIGSVLDSNQDNVYVGSSSQQFVDCFLNGATRYQVNFDNSGSRTKLTNCKIESGQQHGIVMDTTTASLSDIVVSSCNFKDNGLLLTNTYDDILLTRSSGTLKFFRLLVTGSNFTTSSATLVRYGVNLGGSISDTAQVTGNVFGPSSHFGTAAVNRPTTVAGAVVRNNMNVVDFAPVAPLVAKTSAYTITDQDSVVLANGTFTVTLPTAIGRVGVVFVIKNVGVGVITVGTTLAQTIDGATTNALSSQYARVTVISDGANWNII